MGLFSFLFQKSDTKHRIKEFLILEALILDVRTNAEFASGHIKGSRNIPLESLAVEMEMIKNMHKPVIVCCASGMRSAKAARQLKANGIICENGGGWTQLNRLV